MKTNKIGTFGVLLSLVVVGCQKHDPEPISQTQSKLLAGNTDRFKTWKIVSGTALITNGSTVDLTFKECFSDNTYTFQNNSTQIYVVREGATKCDASDPDITESGSWAFTQDAKNIILHAQSFSTTSATFAYVDAQVIELTATSMKISYNTGDSSHRAKVTFVFKTVTKS